MMLRTITVDLKVPVTKLIVGTLGSILICSLATAQVPQISDGGVLNGAGFQKGQPIAPGSLISIFGTQLASRTAQADSIPLSTSLGGVTVQFVNGNTKANAPLLFVTPDNPAAQASSQINAQVPWNLVPPGSSATVTVIVTRDGVTSQPSQVNVAPFSPAIFSSNGRAVAINNSDQTLAWPTGAVAGVTSHPAKIGDAVVIYANGLGAVDSPVDDGQNSLDKLRNTAVKPTVLVGGITAQVLFSGLSPQFVGVNQLNILIPNTAPGDNVPLQIQVGGMTTPDSITIAVSQ
jgi:uncharacterized protein (TIGR03437 family)